MLLSIVVRARTCVDPDALRSIGRRDAAAARRSGAHARRSACGNARRDLAQGFNGRLS
ncbi:hypothetical protein BURMUCGD2M_0906 [Burkholderia multivorans CGD2M]|uniref:Uncharacterized protein n=1 Tax=Burkholderia multivorans CGD2 TaxID=513052 RepID=B9BTK5_9BURK|nr:hypothetical protein BURMUCGD2_0815 [Burkholderia multivorans CGD2]EEE12807.1 hypothetical protein BURMUCGD2M_0906 [Burkholderia multivorans CGD2M]